MSGVSNKAQRVTHPPHTSGTGHTHLVVRFVKTSFSLPHQLIHTVWYRCCVATVRQCTFPDHCCGNCDCCGNCEERLSSYVSHTGQLLNSTKHSSFLRVLLHSKPHHMKAPGAGAGHER